jgi:hypothetical protein
MISSSFRELGKLSATWHEEVSLLRDMAKKADTAQKRTLTVMADTYLVCASALDEFLGEETEEEAQRAMAHHA